MHFKSKMFTEELKKLKVYYSKLEIEHMTKEELDRQSFCATGRDYITRDNF